MSDVQSLRVTIKNNAERIWPTCGPIMTNYQEGKSEYELTVNIYSKDPTFRNRLFTGGQAPNSTMPNYKTAQVTIDNQTKQVGYLESPLCKKLLPMPQAAIVSYDTCRDIEEGQDLGTTVASADFRFAIYADDIVFKQMSWERGDSSRVMDNLSSAECRAMCVEVLSDVPNYQSPASTRYNTNVTETNMITNNITP